MPEQTIWRMDSGRETGMIILNLLTHWPNYLEVQALSSLLFCLVGTVMNFMISHFISTYNLNSYVPDLVVNMLIWVMIFWNSTMVFIVMDFIWVPQEKLFFPTLLICFWSIVLILKSQLAYVYMCKSRSWIPKELTKLWTPKPEKPKKKHQKETDRDCFINKRRERKEKWLLRRRRRPKNSCKLPHSHTQSGFQTL